MCSRDSKGLLSPFPSTRTAGRAGEAFDIHIGRSPRRPEWTRADPDTARADRSLGIGNATTSRESPPRLIAGSRSRRSTSPRWNATGRIGCVSACAGDEGLRREGESLLGYEGAADPWIERPAPAVAAPMLNTSASSAVLTARQIGGYQIGGLLGAGGIGEVYRARDTQLHRGVALKVLPAAFTLDADRLARFKHSRRDDPEQPSVSRLPCRLLP